MAKCGDCIHADICKEVNGGWFSPENIAYCKGFKDRTNYAEVVRCNDCKHYKTRSQSAKWKPKAPCCTRAANIFTKPDDFCSYGERREGE